MGVSQRKNIYVNTLHGASDAWMLRTLFEQYPKIVVLAPSKEEAERLYNDALFLSQKKDALLPFPSWDTLPFEMASPSTEQTAQRIFTLTETSKKDRFMLIASADALLQKMIPGSYFSDQALTLALHEYIDREALLTTLDNGGFKRVPVVENLGEYAVRGGVLDVFPSTERNPVRIQFSGDTISKLRYFDTASQLSTSTLTTVTILPVKEILSLNSFKVHFQKEAQEQFITLQKLAERATLLSLPHRDALAAIELLSNDSRFEGIETLYPIFISNLQSPLFSFSEDTLFVVTDYDKLFQELKNFHTYLNERYTRELEEPHLLPAPNELYISYDEFDLFIKERNICIFNFLGNKDAIGVSTAIPQSIKIKTENTLELKAGITSHELTESPFKPLEKWISKWRKKGFQILFTTASHGRSERLQRMLIELGIDAAIINSEKELKYQSESSLTDPVLQFFQDVRNPLQITTGGLSAGFKIIDQKVIVVPEHEIFGEKSHTSHTSKKQYSMKRLLSSLAKLHENDYVVHAEYGIGIYRGLKHITVEEITADFLQIDYADSTLYVPVYTISNVSKYSTSESSPPKIDKLGSKRWTMLKLKVKQDLMTQAGDLINLYAKRNVSKGWRFDPSGAEDERFAEGFPYRETKDQLQAIRETLNDMASDKPMERTICGDVGFGKTEVAQRAAFKCIQHAKQVVVLVPTTILAEQHLKSFQERFLEFPVSIKSVSKYHTPQENKAILEGLKKGDVDIVIGTHRLLQKDVEFFDLGLIIIDEEHRFGVMQKERLKRFKSHVDILSLTATPIPRTLHMSLLGIRDISLIATPPTDRKLIKTYVYNQNPYTLRDAILREKKRGGQVFYVHNNISTIGITALQLKELVPEVSVDFAHGQMHEGKIEDVMQRFIDKKIDILVATTVIESGIDVPNANTIIVENAQNYGLAQLYQLRGRVGRGERQGYAYFLIPKTREFTESARQRLNVIQSIDELGVGFQLAVRDLEIRGAGNLLGKEQSGNVNALGYELYHKVLEEAVLNVKGEEPAIFDTVDPELKLGIIAYIPDYFVPDVSERLILYQRLSGVRSFHEVEELQREMEDRFGDIPEPALQYLELMKFRYILRSSGIVKAEWKSGKLNLSLSPKAPVDLQKIMEITKKESSKYKFGKNLTLTIILPEDIPFNGVFRETEQLVEKIAHETEHKISELPPS
jgi:transcription-repair coupling factor (superfamily II helicase)